MTGESMNLNINYLLFQFIHLASEQDDNVNKPEILREMMTAHLPIRERELIHTTELFSMKT